MLRRFRDFLFRRVLWEIRQQSLSIRNELLAMEGRLMTAADDANAKLDRIDTATTNIAADIRAIRATAGMTQAEADALNARLDKPATTLEALDAENPEGQA